MQEIVVEPLLRRTLLYGALELLNNAINVQRVVQLELPSARRNQPPSEESAHHLRQSLFLIVPKTPSLPKDRGRQ
jgi:hypothetical protein